MKILPPDARLHTVAAVAARNCLTMLLSTIEMLMLQFYGRKSSKFLTFFFEFDNYSILARVDRKNTVRIVISTLENPMVYVFRSKIRADSPFLASWQSSLYRTHVPDSQGRPRCPCRFARFRSSTSNVQNFRALCLSCAELFSF